MRLISGREKIICCARSHGQSESGKGGKNARTLFIPAKGGPIYGRGWKAHVKAIERVSLEGVRTLSWNIQRGAE